MHLLFFILVISAFFASIMPVLRGSPRLLIQIQMILTGLILVALVADWRFALWLHSMPYLDPVRLHWDTVLGPYCSAAWFTILILWLTFTVAHVVLILVRKK